MPKGRHSKHKRTLSVTSNTSSVAEVAMHDLREKLREAQSAIGKATQAVTAWEEAQAELLQSQAQGAGQDKKRKRVEGDDSDDSDDSDYQPPPPRCPNGGLSRTARKTRRRRQNRKQRKEQEATHQEDPMDIDEYLAPEVSSKSEHAQEQTPKETRKGVKMAGVKKEQHPSPPKPAVVVDRMAIDEDSLTPQEAEELKRRAAEERIEKAMQDKKERRRFEAWKKKVLREVE